MIFDFSKEHAEFISGLGLNPDADMTVDEQLELENRVSEYLQMHGIGKDGRENRAGALCVEILAFIAEKDRAD